MSYFTIHTIFCITTFIAALVTSSLANDDARKKKGDIEEFIDRLLTSDKFDQLAEKIAEKAADKIIYLQRQEELTHNTNHSAKHNSKPKIKKHEKDDSNETLQIKHPKRNYKKKTKKEKTLESESEEIHQRAKIDDVAVKHKFSVFPQESLSLKYNQFTTTVSKPLTTSVLMSSLLKTEESAKEHAEGDHKKKNLKKKHIQNQKSDEITNQEERLPKKLQDKIENSDGKVASKESNENEKKKDDNNSSKQDPSFRSKAENNEKLSESYSESDVSISDSNEGGYSSTNHNDHGDSKATFGLAETGKSSKEEIESDSFENEVSIATEPANLKKSTKTDNAVELRDKVRERDGKKYAFAQSFEYEDYHQKVSELLDKVKNKSIRRNTVNKDLLDLLQ